MGSQGRANVSHGCTGMSTANAQWLFDQSKVGDVAIFTGSKRDAGVGQRLHRLGDAVRPVDLGRLSSGGVTPSGYEDAGPFQARLAIYAWQRDPVDLPGLAVAGLDGVTGVVLDVGCGPGRYADRIALERPDLRVASVDLSPGMRPRIVADARRLPFADASAGAALAMHMLYHVTDMPAAVAELRRVVRPGGVVLVSTNRADNMPELRALVDAACRGPRRGAGGS